EKHWERFCDAFERADWKADPRLHTNNNRIDQREWFLPEVEKMMKTFTKQEIMDKCEVAGITFAPITKPEDLFNDIQLN
ncbi:CoA transferase, partial [Klebsiella pneumoniae]|uniref:CoA transferase n=1 Tax=Klebsiella pneumoniae TaxID=573 RepID=UPI0038522094